MNSLKLIALLLLTSFANISMANNDQPNIEALCKNMIEGFNQKNADQLFEDAVDAVRVVNPMASLQIGKAENIKLYRMLFSGPLKEESFSVLQMDVHIQNSTTAIAVCEGMVENTGVGYRNKETLTLSFTKEKGQWKWHSLVVSVLPHPALSAMVQKQKDESEIRQLIQTLADAWSKGDGELFASSFSDTHDFIVWNGYYFPNQSRMRNAKAHSGLFNSIFKNTDLYYVVDKVKFITDEVALVHFYGALVKDGEPRPKDPSVLISTVIVKGDDGWKIESFHNLDLESFQDEKIREASPIPLELMYASWYAKNEKE